MSTPPPPHSQFAPFSGRTPFPTAAVEPRDMRSSGESEYDALADLFLGERTPAPRVLVRPPGRSNIEAVIVGHLPVLASAWVQQYARHRSIEQQSPIAMIRLRAGEASVELIGAKPDSLSPAASLNDALSIAAAHASVWLVRVDEPDEPALPETPGVGTLTVLTGADEAAVVSAYRTLKHVAPRGGDEASPPNVRIAIMGADPLKAAQAVAKLERAAEAFLGTPVQVSACVAKIGGAPTVPLYRGPWEGDVTELLALVRSASPRSARTALRHPPAERPAPAPSGRPTTDAVVSRLGKLHSGGSTPAPARLAGHIPGLTALSFDCPYAPGVEVAADEHGAIHLLGRLEGQGLGALMTAQSWIKAHAGLIRLAAGSHVNDAGLASPATLHLFTSDARRVRALGDAAVRLHLLASVEAGGQSVWFSTPLN